MEDETGSTIEKWNKEKTNYTENKHVNMAEQQTEKNGKEHVALAKQIKR